MRTVDMVKDFDGPRDAASWLDALTAKGVPHEAVGENEIVVFEDEADREKWLELASLSGSLPAKRRRLKAAVDRMSAAEVDRILEELDLEEMA